MSSTGWALGLFRIQAWKPYTEQDAEGPSHGRSFRGHWSDLNSSRTAV